MSSTAAKVGTSVSPVAAVLITVTVKDIDPWFPAASAAVQVIVVMPTGNRLPDEGVHVGPTVTPMLSFT